MGTDIIRGRLLALTGFLIVALGIGCATPMAEDTPLEDEFAGAPDWVVRGGCPDDDEIVCGVGAVSGSRNISLMRTAAIGRARTEIARSLRVGVASMLKDYQATTTGGRDFGMAANDEQHIQDVSKQITDMTLAGTQMTDSWVSDSGTFWALVTLDVEKFSEAVGQMDQLSETIRQAVVDRADDAFAELDESTGL